MYKQLNTQIKKYFILYTICDVLLNPSPNFYSHPHILYTSIGRLYIIANGRQFSPCFGGPEIESKTKDFKLVTKLMLPCLQIALS